MGLPGEFGVYSDAEIFGAGAPWNSCVMEDRSCGRGVTFAGEENGRALFWIDGNAPSLKPGL